MDADGLTSEHLAKVDLLFPQTDSTTPSDDDGFVVEGLSP
jgi:hypothetical protein